MSWFMGMLGTSIAVGLGIMALELIFALSRKVCAAKYRKIGWILAAVCLLIPANLISIPQIYTMEIPNAVIRDAGSDNSQIANGIQSGLNKNGTANNNPAGLGNPQIADGLQSDLDKSEAADNNPAKAENSERAGEVQDFRMSGSVLSNLDGDKTAGDNTDDQTKQPSRNALDFEITTMHIVSLAWMAVGILLIVYYLAGYRKLRHGMMRWSRECRDENVLKMAEEVAKELDLKKMPKIRFMQSDDKGPFTMGLWKPVIFLPQEAFSAKDLAYILKHEMVHCREHDIFWKVFLTGVNIIHWFNPLVWRMRKLADQDMEGVCDEEVLKDASLDQRKEYSDLILACIERSRHRNNAFSTAYVSGNRFLKRRFADILNGGRKHGKMLVGAVVMVLLFVIGSIRVEGRKVYQPQDTPNAGETPNVSEIPIDYGLEVRTDVDGDGQIERVYVNDNVSGDYAFTQLSAAFKDGSVRFINYDEDYYSSYLVTGDLSGNGAADVVVVRISIGSNFGGGNVNILHMGENGWEEYPNVFIQNPALEASQMEGFEPDDSFDSSCLGAAILEKDGKTFLRLIIAEDMTTWTGKNGIAKCFDCTWHGDGWFIEDAQMIEDYWDKEEEVLGQYLVPREYRTEAGENSDNSKLLQKQDMLGQAPEELDNKETLYPNVINRHGELYEDEKDAAGLKECLDNLAWMAPRSGEVIAEDVDEQENPYIAESIQAMEGLAEEDAEDAIWIRVIQDAVIPAEGTFGGMEHKDYLFYRQDESACVCIQSAENPKLWTIWEMPGYGDYLEKEIDIYIRMTTGL